jgi:hypothetical protein
MIPSGERKECPCSIARHSDSTTCSLWGFSVQFQRTPVLELSENTVVVRDHVIFFLQNEIL